MRADSDVRHVCTCIDTLLEEMGMSIEVMGDGCSAMMVETHIVMTHINLGNILLITLVTTYYGIERCHSTD